MCYAYLIPMGDSAGRFTKIRFNGRAATKGKTFATQRNRVSRGNKNQNLNHGRHGDTEKNDKNFVEVIRYLPSRLRQSLIRKYLRKREVTEKRQILFRSRRI